MNQQQDYKKLKQKVLNLYNQYVQGDNTQKKRYEHSELKKEKKDAKKDVKRDKSASELSPTSKPKQKPVKRTSVHKAVNLQHMRIDYRVEENDQQKEIMKERAHLETSVNNLKQKHDKNQNVHKSDTQIIMKHNTFLIFEINHLKREKKKILEEKAKMLMYATQKKKQDGTSRVDLDSLEKEIQKNEDEKRKLKEDIEKLRLYNDQIKNQLRQQIQNQQEEEEEDA